MGQIYRPYVDDRIPVSVVCTQGGDNTLHAAAFAFGYRLAVWPDRSWPCDILIS